MEIKILFDNCSVNDQLKTGLGFSCLVDQHLLFDTGPTAEDLSVNLSLLNIDTTRIKSIVISHNHWDHTGGLEVFLQKNPPLPVYICPNFTSDIKEKIVRNQGEVVHTKPFQPITNNIFSTGELPCFYKDLPMPEQALILKTNKGISVLTGCAHPGIIQIVKKIRTAFQNEVLYSVIGGFHLNAKEEKELLHIIKQFKKMGVKRAGPCHCTGSKAIELFQKAYGSKFINILSGKVLEV